MLHFVEKVNNGYIRNKQNNWPCKDINIYKAFYNSTTFYNGHKIISKHLYSKAQEDPSTWPQWDTDPANQPASLGLWGEEPFIKWQQISYNAQKNTGYFHQKFCRCTVKTDLLYVTPF